MLILLPAAGLIVATADIRPVYATRESIKVVADKPADPPASTCSLVNWQACVDPFGHSFVIDRPYRD